VRLSMEHRGLARSTAGGLVSTLHLMRPSFVLG